MRESINTTMKSKYTRVSRLVSSRDKSDEQIYRLESWQITKKIHTIENNSQKKMSSLLSLNVS